MRRILTALLGLVLLGTALTVGAAHAGDQTPSEFQIAIVVGEGELPSSGSTVAFDAALVDASQAPVAGVPVTLLVRPYGSSVFTPAAQVVTGADGSARAEVALRYTSAVHWSYDGSAEHAATTSAVYVQPIAPRVAAHAVDRTLRVRQRGIVVGRTGPNKAGNRVSLWRGDKPAFTPNQEMTRIAVGVVRADGTFRLTTRFAAAGVKRLYVKVNAGKGNGVGYSKYIRVRVRKA